MTGILKAINNSCNVCRAMGTPPPCFGHGKGGSGGGSGGGGESDGQQNSYTLNTYSSPAVNQAVNTPDPNQIAIHALLDHIKIDYTIGSLHVEFDKIHGNLILRIQPGIGQDDIKACKELFTLLQSEFNDFLDNLKEHRVPVTTFSATQNKNQLNINIPNPKYFNEFLQMLDQLNLLPLPLEQQGLISEGQTYKSLSPFGDISKNPRPKAWKEKSE